MARLNNSIRLKESNESLMTLKPQGEQNLDSASVYSGLHLRRETRLVLLDSRADLARNAREFSPRSIFRELQITEKRIIRTKDGFKLNESYYCTLHIRFTVALNIIITTTPFRVIKRLNHDSFCAVEPEPRIASINRRDIHQGNVFKMVDTVPFFVSLINVLHF